MYLSPFGNEKKLRIWIGFGETVAVEGPVRMLSQKERLLKIQNKPALELTKRPALIDLCAGRITVDARE